MTRGFPPRRYRDRRRCLRSRWYECRLRRVPGRGGIEPGRLLPARPNRFRCPLLHRRRGLRKGEGRRPTGWFSISSSSVSPLSFGHAGRICWEKIGGRSDRLQNLFGGPFGGPRSPQDPLNLFQVLSHLRQAVLLQDRDRLARHEFRFRLEDVVLRHDPSPG